MAEASASTNKRECMIIASFGNQLPSDVNTARKPRNEARATESQRKLNLKEGRRLSWEGETKGGWGRGEGRRTSGGKLPPATPDIDLKIVQDLLTADTSKELVNVSTDLPGKQKTRYYYIRKIEDFLKYCQEPGGWIWYTGHSEVKTGNWCFKDGTISFLDIFSLLMRHFRGRTLTIISDCCYSGSWVAACAEALDGTGILPCGHKAEENGIRVKIYASCQPDQLATDPCYSLDAVRQDKHGHILLRNRATLSDTQKTYGADFTRLTCFREPEGSCRESILTHWRWVDVVTQRIRKRLCLVRPPGKSWWYYMLLYSEEDSYMKKFNAEIASGRVEVGRWGEVLASGRGDEPPEELRRRVERGAWL